MGASIAPFLRRELASESDRLFRMVLTGAVALADRGIPVEYFNAEILKRTPRQRLIALQAIALGPRQTRGGAALLKSFAKRRSQSPLEQIVLCLALARLQDTPKLPRRYSELSDGPGVLAAALYCRSDQRLAAVKNRVKRFGAAGHQDLVWRSYLLGRGGVGRVEDDRAQLAVDVLRGVGETMATPREAAWQLAHRSRGGVDLTANEVRKIGLEPALLLAHDRVYRSHLLHRGPVPRSSERQILVRRWLVLYALFAGDPEITVALREWRDSSLCRDPGVRKAIGLALAARRFGVKGPGTALPPDWKIAWLGPAAVPWLRISAGEDTGTGVPTESGELGLGFRLLRRGQLTRAAAAAMLLRELWRSGLHPARCGVELHRQLLAELLLDGCKHAGPDFVGSARKPFTAPGISREDQVFRVCREYFKFVTQFEPWGLEEFAFPR